MIAPIEKLRAIPIFYPVSADGTPRISFLESRLHFSPVAMLAAHYFGLPQPMRQLAAFCQSHGIALIEDCAHCFYGESDDAPVGTIGNFCIGSLPKFFPTSEGGILASLSPFRSLQPIAPASLGDEIHATWDMVDIAARADRLGVVGSIARTISRHRGSSLQLNETEEVSVELDSFVLRTTGLSDPLLQVRQLTRIESIVAQRQSASKSVKARNANYLRFAKNLAGLPGLSPVYESCSPSSAPYAIPLLMRDPDKAYTLMRAMQLPVFRWDLQWPGTPSIDGDAGKKWSRDLVQVATHQSLSFDDVDEISQRLADCAHPSR